MRHMGLESERYVPPEDELARAVTAIQILLVRENKRLLKEGQRNDKRRAA